MNEVKIQVFKELMLISKYPLYVSSLLRNLTFVLDNSEVIQVLKWVVCPNIGIIDRSGGLF